MKINNFEYTEQEVKAMKAALNEIDIDSDRDSLSLNIKGDYLTTNTGRDGKKYAWYLDDTNNVIVGVEDLKVYVNPLLPNEEWVAKNFL